MKDCSIFFPAKWIIAHSTGVTTKITKQIKDLEKGDLTVKRVLYQRVFQWKV